MKIGVYTDEFTFKDIDFKQETVFQIGKFSILWSMFEKYKCHNHCKISKLLVMRFNMKRETLENAATVLKDRVPLCWETYREEDLKHEPNAGVSLLQRKDIEAAFYPSEESKLGDWEKHSKMITDFIESNGCEQFFVGALLAIQRIRNNLFHGLKDPEDLDKQVNLFTAINKILEEILSEK